MPRTESQHLVYLRLSRPSEAPIASMGFVLRRTDVALLDSQVRGAGRTSCSHTLRTPKKPPVSKLQTGSALFVSCSADEAKRNDLCFQLCRKKTPTTGQSICQSSSDIRVDTCDCPCAAPCAKIFAFITSFNPSGI